MNREEAIAKGCKKARKTINNMMESRDENYIQEIVRIDYKLSLEVNCFRTDDTCPGGAGIPVQFEIYAILRGNTVDCVTVESYGNFDKEIEYLLKCYI